MILELIAVVYVWHIHSNMTLYSPIQFVGHTGFEINQQLKSFNLNGSKQ